MKLSYFAIKKYCGKVYEHSYTLSGFMGHIYGRDSTDRCGFYSKKACNPKNCPIYNGKRGYGSRLKDIKEKYETK